jgi:hypothetical protein
MQTQSFIYIGGNRLWTLNSETTKYSQVLTKPKEEGEIAQTGEFLVKSNSLPKNSKHYHQNDVKSSKSEAGENRTPNLRVWNPTRCHCAAAPSMEFFFLALPSQYLLLFEVHKGASEVEVLGLNHFRIPEGIPSVDILNDFKTFTKRGNSFQRFSKEKSGVPQPRFSSQQT